MFRSEVRKKIVALKDHSGLAAEFLELASCRLKRATIELYCAGIGNLEPIDTTQQRALSGSAASNDCDDFASLDVQRDSVEDHMVTEVFRDAF